jgi:hypothetical protein
MLQTLTPPKPPTPPQKTIHPSSSSFFVARRSQGDRLEVRWVVSDDTKAPYATGEPAESIVWWPCTLRNKNGEENEGEGVTWRGCTRCECSWTHSLNATGFVSTTISTACV